MARNADTQNNTSSCRNNYENRGGQDSTGSMGSGSGLSRGGQNSSKNKSSNKSSNKAAGTGGEDSYGGGSDRGGEQ